MSDTTTVTTEQTRTETETTDVLAGLTDAQRTEINRRAADARRDGERTAAAKLKAEADAKAETDRVKREEEDKAAAGKFDEAKALIERRAADAESKAETATQRADRLTALAAKQVEARIVALKAAPDLETAFTARFPADGDHDPLDQLEWLDDGRTVAALAKATAGTDAHRDALRGAAGVIPQSRGEMTDAQRVAQERQHLVASGRIPKF